MDFIYGLLIGGGVVGVISFAYHNAILADEQKIVAALAKIRKSL